jgi:hypothetical protein
MTRSLFAVLALSFGILSPALAQPAKSKPSTKPADAPTAVLLENEPFRIEAVGLAINLPKGSKTQTTRSGSVAAVQVLPAAGAGDWIMTISTTYTNINMTPLKAAEELAKSAAESVGATNPTNGMALTRAQVLDRFPEFKIPGSPSAGTRFYIAIPRDNAPRLVKGYTLFKPSAEQMVVFELRCDESAFPAARRAYETAVATARFADNSALETSRKQIVTAGREVLDALTPEQINAALPTGERWYRMYRPAAAAGTKEAEELGYYGVRFWKGKRGELNQGSGTFSGENPDGYLVEIRGRIFAKQGDTTQVIDTASTCFILPDRSEEMWSTRTVARGNGANAGLWVENGARTGTSMQVEIRPPGKPAELSTPVVPPVGYASQFETHLIPRLLVRAGKPGEFGFYNYRSDTGSVGLRRDTLEKPKAGPGAWLVLSKQRDDDLASKAYFNAQGDLVRIERANGTIEEPIELSALTALLASKNLPTGPVK